MSSLLTKVRQLTAVGGGWEGGGGEHSSATNESIASSSLRKSQSQEITLKIKFTYYLA